MTVCDISRMVEEVTDNLEDAEVPAPAHISHDSDSDVLRKWRLGSTVFKLTSEKTEMAKSSCEPR